MLFLWGSSSMGGKLARQMGCAEAHNYQATQTSAYVQLKHKMTY